MRVLSEHLERGAASPTIDQRSEFDRAGIGEVLAKFERELIEPANLPGSHVLSAGREAL